MDSDLIERAKRRDNEAFTALVHHFGDRLYAVAYRILRDTSGAEDAVQQTFLIAWRELPKLREPQRLQSWLFTILVNACRTEMRHVGRWRPGLRVVTDFEPPVDDSQRTIAQRDELERAFRRLSTEQRAVIVLHHYIGLSGDEIGRVLGLPAGTVRSRLHYARQQMRAAIEADARAIASEGLA
ncbi:MAG: RNA polymerase sigma factor [Candidatus Limnocylindria bacterium]